MYGAQFLLFNVIVCINSGHYVWRTIYIVQCYSMLLHASTERVLHFSASYYTGAIPLGGDLFRGDQSPGVTNVNCIGSEGRFRECSYQQPNDLVCETAAVICQGM